MTGLTSIKKISSLTSDSFSTINGIFTPIWNALLYDFSDLLLPQSCIGVTIEQTGFSIAYVAKAFGQFKIKGVKKYSFDSTYPDADFFASSIALALNEFKVRNVPLTLSIPKSWVITKVVEFPSTVKEDIFNVISYEMDRFTPFNSEDALYDFKIIDESDEKIKVLLVATRSQLLKPYIESLANKGIIVQRITLNTSAVESIINYSFNQISYLYLEIGDKGYEGGFFLQSNPINFFTGEFRETDDKSRLLQLVEDIRYFINSNKKNDIYPQIYILFKDKGYNLKEGLKLALNMPFKVLNESDIKINFSVQKDSISYPAVGCALETLWQKSNGLNLLSNGQVIKKSKPKALTILLLMILIFAGIIYTVAPLYIENKRIEDIDHQIAVRKDEVKRVEALKKEIEALQKDIATINGFKHDKQMTLNIVKEITTIIPKNAWLTRLRITDKTIEIEGYASSATELLPKLEASKFLQKVEFASPTFRDARMNADRFNIKMEIEGVSKQETADAKQE